MADDNKHEERSETEREAAPAKPAEASENGAPETEAAAAEAELQSTTETEAAAEAEPQSTTDAEPTTPAAQISPAPALETSPPPRSALGGVALGLAAALVGGAVALGGQYIVLTQFGPLHGLEGRLATLDGAAKSDAVEIEALRKRVGTLQETLGTRIGKLETLSADALKDVGGRVDKLDAAIWPKPGSSEPPEIRAELARLSADLTTATDHVGQLTSDAAASAARLNKLEAGLADASSGAAAAKVVAGFVVQKRLAEGRPYASDLATLAKLGADADALAALKPFAETGAPTRAAMAAQFAKLAPSLIATERAAPGGSVAEKWMASLRTLVRVRPAVEVTGDAPEALITQTQAALDRGDFAAAIVAFDKLPELSRAGAGSWAKQAAALARAAAGADAIVAAALRGLVKD